MLQNERNKFRMKSLRRVGKWKERNWLKGRRGLLKRSEKDLKDIEEPRARRLMRRDDQ